MNTDYEFKFFSAPGKIRLKPLCKNIKNESNNFKFVNNYIII
jgi:hypothetical protein